MTSEDRLKPNPWVISEGLLKRRILGKHGDAAPRKSTSFLDCYWVGSLDFNFFGK